MTCSTRGCIDGKILGLFETYDCPECRKITLEEVHVLSNWFWTPRGYNIGKCLIGIPFAVRPLVNSWDTLLFLTEHGLSKHLHYEVPAFVHICLPREPMALGRPVMITTAPLDYSYMPSQTISKWPSDDLIYKHQEEFLK